MPRGDDAAGLPDLMFPFRGLASIPLSERSASRLVLLRCNCILVTKKPRQRAPGTRRGCDGSPCNATIRNTKAGARACARSEAADQPKKASGRTQDSSVDAWGVFFCHCAGPQTPLFRLRLESFGARAAPSQRSAGLGSKCAARAVPRRTLGSETGGIFAVPTAQTREFSSGI